MVPEVAVSSLTFSRLPLAEALPAVAALGFRAVELAAHEGWAHLSPAELAGDASGVTERVVSALHAAGLHAVALNAGLGRNADIERQAQLVAALCRLAVTLGAGVLTIPAAPPPTGNVVLAAAAEIRRLEVLVGVAAPFGVALAVEGHIGAVTEDPAAAAALCRAVPGLRLTLDPSHYWAGPAQGRGWEAVLAHVAHVHLRDAGRDGWPAIQIAAGRGAVDFRTVLSGLRAAGYRGAYAVEYIDSLPVVGGTTAAAEAVRMAHAAAEWLT